MDILCHRERLAYRIYNGLLGQDPRTYRSLRYVISQLKNYDPQDVIAIDGSGEYEIHHNGNIVDYGKFYIAV